MTILREHEKSLDELCRKHGVERLDAFGSVVSADFDAERSDIDFVVRFAPCEPAEHAERYFGLLNDLEDLFGRGIDLVEEGAVKNPYFREAMNRSRTPVYGA